VKALSAANLNKFNVLVLPDGDSDRYQELFGKEGISRLKAWVEQGGVLIGLGGGAELFTLKDVDLTSSRAVGDEEPPKPRPLPLPGAAFRAHLDPHHFLSYGYSPNDLVVLLRGSTFLKPSKAGANVVTFPQGNLAVAGFEWPNNTENLLHGTSYLIDEPTGDGHVILFADDPNFRYLWRTASRLLLNGILFAPALR